MPDDLATLLANIEREHAAHAEQEAARQATAQQIARLNARTPKRGGADLAAGERDDDDTDDRSGSTNRPDGHAFTERGLWDDQATLLDMQGQHAQHDRMVAAEAPPSVPGHLADRQRSPQVDPYSPDQSLYSPEWLAEFDRRCAEAVAQMKAAMGAQERP